MTTLPHDNLYTRLQVSTYGVGVFAIRDIAVGVRPFDGDTNTIVRVPRAVVEQIEDSELKRMYFDFCPTVDGAFIAPVDFNQLTTSWYMNHSADPNIHTDRNIRFTCCRAIAAGEELTINYAQFSEHAPEAIATWGAR